MQNKFLVFFHSCFCLPKFNDSADLQIVVQPGSLAARNYYSLQKLFGKNHALFVRIKIIWQNRCAFVLKSQLLYLTQISFMEFLSREQFKMNFFYQLLFSLQKTFLK